LLEALIGAKTYDQNVLSFQFTTTVSSVNGVSADFVFGSEEYPVFTGGYPVFSSSIFDVFGFFVDGENCAVYSDGSLVSAALRDNFIDNSANVRYGNSYRLEYNGLIPSQHVECEFDQNRTVHTLTIAIADTGGQDWDSGVFIGNLQGVKVKSGS
jgi:hypothetical protein